MEPITESLPYTVIVLPLLVFVARILDVTIGTLRIIFVSRGWKSWAGLLGFFESLIWLIAVAQVIHNLSSWQTYIAFALGFGAGNYIGVLIEEKIALGNLLVRVITRRPADELIGVLRGAGYGVTSVRAEGETGPVSLIFTIAKRRNLESILGMIKKHNPRAFYTVEDMRFVSDIYAAPINRHTLIPRLALPKGK